MSNISIVGVNIKRFRELMNLTVTELASKAGVGTATISQIETGKRQSLNTNTIEKIAEALNVKPDNLFGLQEGEKYVVTDLEETLKIILQSEEMTIDGTEMTKEEKDKFLKMATVIIDSIKFNRK